MPVNDAKGVDLHQIRIYCISNQRERRTEVTRQRLTSMEDHNIQGLGAYRDVFDADGEQ
jgi:hypothetical protein